MSELITRPRPRNIRTSVSLWATLLAILSGCSQVGIGPKSDVITNDEYTSMSTTISSDIRIQPPAGAMKKTAVVAYDNVLTNMTTALSVKPSASTITTYQQSQTSFALNGSAEEINASMMMAVATLAGRVCDDLYTQEKARAAESRNFYRDISLTGAANFTSSMGGKTAEDAILDRLVINTWGRPATSAERAEFKSALDAISTTRGNLSEQNAREALLVMCTLALASLQGLEI